MKKKLKKFPAGADGHKQDGFSISKGQWERRLQTDIHMAKQALWEALSIDKPASIPNSKICNPNTRPTQASTYASSAENIAKLLEGWMRNSPKSATTNSETTQNSKNQGSSSSEGAQSQSATTPDAFDSLFSFNSSNSDDETVNLTPENSLFQDESKPNMESQVPLTLLEKWLFDEGTATQDQEALIDMSLEETADQLF